MPQFVGPHTGWAQYKQRQKQLDQAQQAFQQSKKQAQLSQDITLLGQILDPGGESRLVQKRLEGAKKPGKKAPTEQTVGSAPMPSVTDEIVQNMDKFQTQEGLTAAQSLIMQERQAAQKQAQEQIAGRFDLAEQRGELRETRYKEKQKNYRARLKQQPEVGEIRKFTRGDKKVTQEYRGPEQGWVELGKGRRWKPTEGGGPEDRETRTILRGGKKITQEWDAEAGKFKKIGEAPRWKEGQTSIKEVKEGEDLVTYSVGPGGEREEIARAPRSIVLRAQKAADKPQDLPDWRQEAIKNMRRYKKLAARMKSDEDIVSQSLQKPTQEVVKKLSEMVNLERKAAAGDIGLDEYTRQYAEIDLSDVKAGARAVNMGNQVPDTGAPKGAPGAPTQSSAQTGQGLEQQIRDMGYQEAITTLAKKRRAGDITEKRMDQLIAKYFGEE